MAYVKIWVHLVWTTKNRERTLSRPIRNVLFTHIRENAKSKGIYLDFIGGHLEHVHCLISLDVNQTISKVVQLMKGEAAFWFNRNLRENKKLQWQDEYFAVSVSDSKVDLVRNYIKNQEEHHKKKSFQEEYMEFITKHGFEKFSG